jgi:hypothetical protein
VRNFREKLPSCITFQPFAWFLQSTYRSIEVDNQKKWNNEGCFQFFARVATGDFLRKILPKNNFLTKEPISTKNIPIDSTRQPETHKNFKHFFEFCSREQPGIFHGKIPRWITFQPFDRFSRNSKLINSIQQRICKKANIIGAVLLSLKPVVRTRRSYKRAELLKRKKIFSETRHVRPWSVDVHKNASKVIRDTLFSLSCKLY